MALITCPDCKREVSDAAATCPGCARPLQAPPAHPIAVQATHGATGKFLDPAANMRSCLGIIGLGFVLMVGGAIAWMIAH